MPLRSNQKELDVKWVKDYYQAVRDNLTNEEFAKKLGCSTGALSVKKSWFKKMRGIELPPLRNPLRSGIAGNPVKDIKPLKKLRIASTAKPAAPAKDVSPEDIVRAWQTSNSYTEAAEKAGLTPKAIVWRAKRLKEHGVPLKHLKNSSPLNYDALKELALSLAPKPEGNSPEAPQ